MAAGLPIIASDEPLHRALVTNNEHGLLYESDDCGQVEVVIERLLAQPALAAALGSNGRARAIREFDLQARVERFADLFARLIERKPSA
jgi:glycosyltransferase involved in cell wall biosynthesis